jgi:hypothetical protein
MTRPRITRLAVEALEERWAPAGNVSAQLAPDISGDLTVLSIVGDSEANAIRVVEDSPGHVRIEGMGSTTVNGMAVVDLFSSGDEFLLVDIDLRNADDILVYQFTGEDYQQFLQDTTIDTGAGDDTVTVFVHGLIGPLTIDTGVGTDRVTIDLAPDSAIFDGLLVDTGAGDDWLLFRADADGGWRMPALVFGRLFLIDMGLGNDLVQFEGEFGCLGSHLTVHLGNGDDTLIGDPDHVLAAGTVRAFGDLGHDAVFNAAYLGALLFDFEAEEE